MLIVLVVIRLDTPFQVLDHPYLSSFTGQNHRQESGAYAPLYLVFYFVQHG